MSMKHDDFLYMLDVSSIEGGRECFLHHILLACIAEYQNKLVYFVLYGRWPKIFSKTILNNTKFIIQHSNYMISEQKASLQKKKKNDVFVFFFV